MGGMKFARKTTSLLCAALTITSATAKEAWTITSQEDWSAASASHTGLTLIDGAISPKENAGTFQSNLKKFDQKRSVTSITLNQSPIWQNWNPIKNLGPANLADAPVLLTLGPDNYWMFGRYGGARPKKNKTGQKQAAFTPEVATLEGFNIPLQTTRFPNQFDAPGGLKPKLGGYHAWQSRDMVNWVHHGPVTEGFSKWVTSAEHVDGKTYIYYDFPNDQDPHGYVDSDLTDGLPGENKGKVLSDPSHGSDSGFIRDLDGNFHVIFENWNPINASKRAWDSPLAGHAVSPDGISPFKIQKIPPVDVRTEPTGEIKTYKHPHWTKEDPKNYPSSIAEYEVHSPNQEAFGDWAPICIGGQYYLFGDYDSEHGKPMQAAWFTSSDIGMQFTFCDSIGRGHPDPDVCFAEGRFYLATQQKTDYTSPGPWVETVEVRVGVDANNDGKIDKWTEWQELKETYDHTPGFSKQIQKTPASLDLATLPEGYGFQFEIKLTDSTENKSKPILESVELQFNDPFLKNE
ncbi:hypothetical protein N9B14_02145 [Akkermansiaceae bacterium]|nr:hypothetical protein [Akkermansiaceae bacterium]